MAALARLQRTPYYLRPNASLADPVVFGQYYAMRDTSNMSFWQKFASRLTDFFLSRAA